MRRVLNHPILITLLSLLAPAAVPARAQTQASCGCSFVNNQQPRQVRVEFEGSRGPVAAKSGMVVHTGDVIKVTPQSSGTLVCDNVKDPVPLKTTPRNQPVPCVGQPPDGIIIGRQGRKINSNTMNAAQDVDAIVILSPRSTKLLDGRPTLRWTSLAGAASYRVKVRGDEMAWSLDMPAVAGSATQEVRYPPPCAQGQTADCAPPLKPGHVYKLVVEAQGSSSEEEDLPDLGFSVLTDAEVRAVNEKVAEVNRLPVDAPLKTYMLASVYAHNRLNADAIKLLKESPDTARTPDAVRLLGDLYLKIAMTRDAEAQYLSLLKPPLAGLDTAAGAAVTFQTLGEIYEVLGNTDEAVKYYTEARQLFQGLKDQESTKLVERRLSSLTRR